MTARKGEQIMLALLPVLAAAEASITRNTPLPDVVDKVVRLMDGPPAEQTEEFLNPPLYEFTMRPFAQIVVANTDDAARDAAVDAIAQSLVAAADAVTDLGGLITAIRPQPPGSTPRELFGMPGMKATELEIEIDYWSDSSAG